MSYKCPKFFPLFGKPMPQHINRFSSKNDINEEIQKIRYNIKNYYETKCEKGKFYIIGYMYDENSYSLKALQRAFGSYVTAIESTIGDCVLC